jgi:hypothetical protein
MISDIVVYIALGLVLFGPVRWAIRRLPAVQRWRPHRFTTIRPFDRDAASLFAPKTRVKEASWLDLMRVRLSPAPWVQRLLRLLRRR